MKKMPAEFGLRQTSDVESLLWSLRKDFLQKVIPTSSACRLFLKVYIESMVCCFVFNYYILLLPLGESRQHGHAFQNLKY